MKIQEIPIAKIKLDKTQPRKYLDTKRVKNIAKSIKAQGIINPIEIDKDYVIVTGELRYRACKEAGLATVPAKIINIGKDRFERQVIENIHHNTMTSWDTAKALRKLLRIYGKRPPYKRGVRIDLAKKVGRSVSWVTETLSLLGASERVKKRLRQNSLSRTFIREVDYIPEQHRKAVEKKVLSGAIPSRDTLRAMRLVITDNPEKAEDIIALNLKGLNNDQAVRKIDKVAKTKQAKEWEENDYFERLDDIVRKLKKLLAQNPLGKSGRTVSVNEFSKAVVKASMLPLPKMIKDFVHSYDSQPKVTAGVIEGETE